MFSKSGIWQKVVVLLLVLAVIIPLLAACDDDDDDESSTPTDSGPVKIGVLFPWTGAAGMYGLYAADPAIALAEYVIEQRGGVLGGRSVEFIEADTASEVAGGRNGFTKLALQDNVSAVVPGGALVTVQEMSAEMAEEYKVPQFTWRTTPKPDQWRFGTAFSSIEVADHMTIDYVLDRYDPDTVGFIADQDPEYMNRVSSMKNRIEEAGVDTVYDEVVAPGIVDMASYLTRIKHANPDVLIISSANPAWFAGTFEQMAELGGWGTIKVVSNEMAPAGFGVADMPEAEGFVFWSTWVPGLDYPGAKEYEDAVQAVLNKPPTDPQAASIVTFYQILMTAVEAVELAGSDDPQKVQKAAISGGLQWESPCGLATINDDGSVDLPGFMVLVSNGKLIPVTD